MKQSRNAIDSLLLSVALVAFSAVWPNQVFAQTQSTGSTSSWGRDFASGVLTGGTTPFLDLSQSESPLAGLEVSGLLSTTNDMWVNSTGIRYNKSKNSLAAQRNWIQLDINYAVPSREGKDRLFIRWWGIYEPPYPFERNAGLNDTQDFYNQYTVRDAYWKHLQGPLTLFLGRQIVTWGESIAFRVGDVINPQDLTWSFGFNNLEQSRLPLWMIHPIVNLPTYGPFESSFLEGVYAPAWQPMYTQMDYPNLTGPHTNWYDGQHDVGGSVDLVPPFNLLTEGRFGVVPYPATFPAPGGPPAAFPQATNPVPPFFTVHLPGDTWKNSMEGIRFHTLLWNSEFTALYWHAHQLLPTSYVLGSSKSGQVLQQKYPQLNDIGATMNRPLYLPGFLSEVPFVLRTEAVWQDKTPFNTVDVQVPNAVVNKNTFNTLVALDLDSFSAPWLTKTGTMTSNFEWNNYSISSYGKNLVYGGYAERWRHNEENLLLSTSTSWWWGAVVPTFAAIYNPDGNTFLLFPTVLLTPPWTNKYFLNVGYVGVLGNDKFSSYAGGVFKGKSQLFLQFQYNFELIRSKQN